MLPVDCLQDVLHEFDKRGLVREDSKLKNGFVFPNYVWRSETDLRDGFVGLPLKVHICETRQTHNAYLPEGGCKDQSEREFCGRRLASWLLGWSLRIVEDAIGA